MRLRAQLQGGSAAPRGPILQRKCACGKHTVGGAECPACRKQKMAVSTPGDRLERDADRMASAVMRMPAMSAPASEAAPPAVTPDMEQSIQSKAGRGEPLRLEDRAFFESAYGTNFSRVRVHADPSSAELSSRLDAEAFTFGNDIFFNRGRYGGRHLLAHELAHVVQQNSGTLERQIQRAKIPYGALAWSDFKKAAPAGTQFAAETSSGVSADSWKTAQDAKPTGNKCTLNKKEAEEFTATVTIDPSSFDGLIAEMNQDESWVKDRFKSDAAGVAFCKTTRAAECQKDFDDQTKQAATDCDSYIKPCKDFFAKQSGTYKVTINGVDIVANNAAECDTLAKTCRTESAKGFKSTLLDDENNTIATASTRKECSEKTFQDACAAHEKVESAWLLKHEQGHFDISNVMAPKVKAALKAKAATLKATATACGQNEALKAALANFDALDPKGTFKQVKDDWVASMKQAEADYDNDTNHGLIRAQQATWEAKIKAGLTAYDLNKPVAPANPTQGTPTP